MSFIFRVLRTLRHHLNVTLSACYSSYLLHRPMLSLVKVSFVVATLFSATMLSVDSNVSGYCARLIRLSLTWKAPSAELAPQLPRTYLSLLGNKYDSFDVASGAQFFNEQTIHLSNVWILIEGLGIPAGSIFDPHEKLSNFSATMSSKADVLSRRNLARNVRSLARESRALDKSMGRFTSSFLLLLLPQRIPYSTLEIASNRLPTIHLHGDSNEKATSVVVDRRIRRLAQSVIDEISSLFKDTLISANVSLALAETASITASSALIQLDSELSRVKKDIASTPWWKSWTWHHWMYESELTRSRKYLRQITKAESYIRYHAEGVLAVRQNLQLLVYYIDWYLTYIKHSEPHKRPRDGARSAREEIAAFLRSLSSLSERAEEAFDPQDRARVIKHPRRILFPLALPRGEP